MIYIAADHRGYKLKETLLDYLERKGFDVVDLGNTKLDPSDDYVDYAARVAQSIKRNDQGILLCGSGTGVALAANKIRGIRAANVVSVRMAKDARTDEDANVLCLGADYVKRQEAERIVQAFLTTRASRAQRHARRLSKIKNLERRGK